MRESVDLPLQWVAEGRETQRPSRGIPAWLSAVNGVCGDHLEATGNPLAIDLHFATREGPFDLDADSVAEAVSAPTRHVVVFLHGLCMSPSSWWRGGGRSLGDRLEADLDVTPLYVAYNSGRHISTNGRELAEALTSLCERWPVPVDSLSLVGHSMGGLVIRSACGYAANSGEPWRPDLPRAQSLRPAGRSPRARAGQRVVRCLGRPAGIFSASRIPQLPGMNREAIGVIGQQGSSRSTTADGVASSG